MQQEDKWHHIVHLEQKSSLRLIKEISRNFFKFLKIISLDDET